MHYPCNFKAEALEEHYMFMKHNNKLSSLARESYNEVSSKNVSHHSHDKVATWH